MTVKKDIYAGLFLVTLATLMFEILLTRIFSVTMWYHMAFMAVSIAMFGMTVGALWVYLHPSRYVPEQVKRQLAVNAFYFSISIVFSFLTHLEFPIIFKLSFMGIYSLTLTYLVISIPFIFSGICVCLALTKFPGHVGKLYAVDLTGAALGCVALIYVLHIFDGPSAVLVVAVIAAFGALFFSARLQSKKLYKLIFLWVLLISIVAGTNTVLAAKEKQFIRLIWVKGMMEDNKEYHPRYEKWNTYSRIAVYGEPLTPGKPFGWGLSSTLPSDMRSLSVMLNIDENASTPITQFNGNVNSIQYLKYDITNLAHYLRQGANVLVVGAGGGRDILSALVFGQKSVTAVEINKEILNTLNQRYGSYSGHLDMLPNVHFVNDEARSYIARSKDKFDMIQVSFIDTWAATAAGAFVLTENSLYTVEAWNTFFKHLTPHGVLTFSRWYSQKTPDEIYRLTTLACAMLKQQGINDPRNHIVLVKKMNTAEKGVGTMIVSKEPFSNQELDTLDDTMDMLQFEPLLTPRYAANSTFAILASGKNTDDFLAKFRINITPPTDDSPFFFNMVRINDLFRGKFDDLGALPINTEAIAVLGALLIVVLVLTILCIIVPLILTTDKSLLHGAMPLFLFFSFIGLGYMFIEISQMQRLIIFLGHPIYGLSVVLFGLLLSSGIGSYLTNFFSPRLADSPVRRFGFLIIPFILILIGLMTPYSVKIFQTSTNPIRIIVSILMLFPLGLFMGMAFPLGMKLASTRSGDLTPWLWGLNGAASVCASVLAVVISLNSGISTTYWTGVVCYFISFVSFLRAKKYENQKSFYCKSET
jgi:hypothetical protein